MRANLTWPDELAEKASCQFHGRSYRPCFCHPQRYRRDGRPHIYAPCADRCERVRTKKICCPLGTLRNNQYLCHRSAAALSGRLEYQSRFIIAIRAHAHAQARTLVLKHIPSRVSILHNVYTRTHTRTFTHAHHNSTDVCIV